MRKNLSEKYGESKKAKIEEKIHTSRLKYLVLSFSYNENPKKYMENTYDRNISTSQI